MAKKSMDMTIDISMAENGGLVVKYFDHDDKEDSPTKEGPGDFGPKTFTFKNTKEAISQISKWLGQEEKEEQSEPTLDTVKADLHKKNIGSTMSEYRKGK